MQKPRVFASVALLTEMLRFRTLLTLAGPLLVGILFLLLARTGPRSASNAPAATAEAPAQPAPPRAHRLDLSTLPAGGSVPGWRASQGNFRLVSLEGATALELPPEPMAEGQFVWNTILPGGGSVRARMWGARKRRVAPRFAVGLVAAAPYWFRVVPLEKKVELVTTGEVRLASADWEWDDTRKVWLELRSSLIPEAERQDGQPTRLEARAWHEGEERPEAPLLRLDITEEFGFVRAVAAAAPYALEPVYIDFLETASR